MRKMRLRGVTWHQVTHSKSNKTEVEIWTLVFPTIHKPAVSDAVLEAKDIKKDTHSAEAGS